MALSNDPMWYKDAVFYELNVKTFADSDGDGLGDFRGIVERLEHLMWLGVDCIWLLPFYPSPLRDDGYDVADYYNVSDAFGTLDDFKSLIESCHAAGIRVITDLVVNHTSDRHPWFIESRSSRDNPKRDWYVWSETNNKFQETRIIFLDTEDSNWAWCDISEQYFWHRFYSEQPDLNYDNPEVREEMLNIMRFWFDMGLDGFRVDAVPYLIEREGTINENLPETHDFVREMRKVVNEEYPGKILLAEANQPAEDTVQYMRNDEFQMGFHFPVMPRLFMGLEKQNYTDIVDIMEITPKIPDSSQWCIFLRNHDELTLEMVTEEERQFMWKRYAIDPRMKLNLGIRRRLASLLQNDRRKMDMMNAILLSLPGSPIIYNGDEIGMGDNIMLRDRDGCRTPMQWNSGKNGGFSSADNTYLPVIDDEIFGYEQVNVAEQRAREDSLLNSLRTQVEVRKRHKAFGRGTCQFFKPENKAVLAYKRSYESDSEEDGYNNIIVLANLSDRKQKAEFKEHSGRAADLLSHKVLDLKDITLEPYECVWLGMD